MQEVELYEPVRDWLVANGYEVRAEVEGCDIAARRDGHLIVIELKCRLSTDLLVQAVERQEMADSVYVAIPAPDCRGHSPRWRGLRKLLRRLELGLIFCRIDGGWPPVEVFFHPMAAVRRKRKRDRMAVLQEMSGRSGDYNVGGSTRRKLVTAYRESALRIACCLDLHGPLAPRKLRALGTGPKTLAILSRNVYNWFERKGRGLYALTPQGREELTQYPDLVSRIRANLSPPSEKSIQSPPVPAVIGSNSSEPAKPDAGAQGKNRGRRGGKAEGN